MTQIIGILHVGAANHISVTQHYTLILNKNMTGSLPMGRHFHRTMAKVAAGVQKMYINLFFKLFGITILLSLML